MSRLMITLAAAFLPAALCACRQEEVPPPLPPLVQTVALGSVGTVKQRFTGVVRARIEANLGFRVAGKVLERLVDPGEHVRRGQPLMRLDPIDFTLASESAHAAVDAARALMLRTGADEERSRKLATAGWSSAQAYDQNKAAADAATAQMGVAEAQARQVANQVGYTELLSDVDGVVMDVLAEPGQVVVVGQAVIKLARDGAREAEVFLPEESRRWADARADASLYVDRDRVFPVQLRELSAIADPSTRTYRARYVLGGAGESAPLGSTVTVALASGLRGTEAVHDVPIGAVFDAGNGTSVWKLNQNSRTVTAWPVTVRWLREETAEVVTDLADDDRIVALGAHLLKEGQQVRVAAARVSSSDR